MPTGYIIFACDECFNPFIEIIKFDIIREEVRSEDVILEREAIFRCPRCGCIQANLITTIIPSWCYFSRREEIRAHPIIPEDHAQ